MDKKIRNISSAILLGLILCHYAGADNWSLFYNGSYSGIQSMAAYNGSLYVGNGFYPLESDIVVFNGSAWSLSYDGDRESVKCMTEYNGKLYAGLLGTDRGDGDILVYDGNSWSISYNGSLSEIASMTVYNGKLYAGQGSSSGDILVFDGNTWQTAYNASGNASATIHWHHTMANCMQARKEEDNGAELESMTASAGQTHTPATQEQPHIRLHHTTENYMQVSEV